MKRPEEVIEGLYTEPNPVNGPGNAVQRLSHAFKDYRDPEDQIKILEYCESPDVADSHHFVCAAGELCLSMALEGEDTSEPGAWLERAERNWQTATQISNPTTDDIYTKATMRLATSPATQARAEGLILPSTERELAYRNLVQSVAVQLETLKNDPYINHGDLAGQTSELAMYLLLERFSIRNDDNCWLALPSLPFEDIGPFVPGKKLSWDVSVFTQYDYATEPDLNYKVQAKTGFIRDRYDKDIAVISLTRDLSIKDGSEPKRLPIHQVIQECYDELFSSNSFEASWATQRLNMREAIFLDLLDERTKVSPKIKQDAA